MKIFHVDCTLRDGGYYNNWDFSNDLINNYLSAMVSASVDIVELGFRSFDVNSYKGACAYTTDRFLRNLNVPVRLSIAVMVNASELVNHTDGPLEAIKLLFDARANSPVEIVRIASHLHEVTAILPACEWLAESGYRVGLNLMQVADRTDEQLMQISTQVNGHGVEVLYFADSLGSLEPDQTAHIIQVIGQSWSGPIGIHTHDNMGRAVSNTLRALREGVTWVDSTMTGMGRGPGNAQTEYLVIELERITGRRVKLAPLLSLIKEHFAPMKERYGWGQNLLYYLAGLHGIHPTFLQEMLSDARYADEDVLSVIDHLKKVGGKKFNGNLLEQGRQRFGVGAVGTWRPTDLIKDKEVLIIGSGPSASNHREALTEYINKYSPFVVVLNTKSPVRESLINLRVACHPIRLLADCEAYRSCSQPLVAPLGLLDEDVMVSLDKQIIYDYGLAIQENTFIFNETSAVVPSSLVLGYALAMCASGHSKRILLAGFDGYGSADPRSEEVDAILSRYQETDGSIALMSVTPTQYSIPCTSIYAL